MNIDSLPPVNGVVQTDSANMAVSNVNRVNQDNDAMAIFGSPLDAETKQAIDSATGLLQTIVTEKISNSVIRKMPSDEYLHLLGLLDDIISGSIDEKI